MFSGNDARRNGHLYTKIRIILDFTPFIKNRNYSRVYTHHNSKWITGLNVKHKAIKLLKDNKGENLDDLVPGDDFLGTTPKA